MRLYSFKMTLIQIALILGCASFVFGRSFDDQFESSLIGPKFCGNGPLLWCQNFTTAIECNAVKHCVDTVWLTQKPSSKVGSCGDCESEIEKIRQGIGSNTTKEVIQELLENICDLTFITELFRKRCEKFIDQYVDNYFNELLDLLKSDIDAATVCHILGFCSEVKSAVTFEDDAVVRFENIILHLPADLVNVAASQKLLGAEKCTWGPSYWCNNITSSRECKSTTHCIRSVWPRQRFDEDDDSVCKICKDMVQQARDQLESNETQQELREVFEGSCKLIPIKEVRNECIRLADEFVPELTEMLLSSMNPTAICTVAGLCNSPRIDDLLSSKFDATDSCANCTAALTAVERYLLRAPRSHVLDKLQRLCDQLSSYSDGCANLVVSNFDSIHDTLLREVRPFAVCHLSGMCAQRYHRHSTTDDAALEGRVDALLATANDDLPCDLCKQLVKHLKDVLTANTTEQEFHQLLRGICQHTGSFKSHCLEIVDENFSKIYKFLAEELDPSEVCREVNLCPKGNAITDENMNLIYSIGSHPSAAQDTQLATSSSAEEPAKAVECRLCRTVIHLVQKEMDKPEYEHNIEKVLQKVCSLAPRSDRPKCDEFIRDYANVLIKILADQTDPGVVCSLLDLCTEANATVANALCPICQYVLHFIQTELEKPQEQQKVEDIVRHICRVVPRREQPECNSFVTDYASLIIGVLSQEIDPSLVCPALNMCPNLLLSPVDRCAQCLRLMDSMVATLDSDRSQRSVANTLRTLVPAAAAANATLTAVQLKVSHADDIADMMSAEFDAPESCVFLRFCDAQTLATASVVEDDAEPGETNDIFERPLPVPRAQMAKPSCELCELVVQLYEDELTSNRTEKQIVDVLQKFCDKIKNPEFRSNCSYFVQKYVPAVVKLLKQDVKPQQVCSLVKLCPQHAPAALEEAERCEMCEAVVGSLEGVASDPLVVSRSVSSLIKVCGVFTEQKVRSQCMKIVSIVGPQLESVLLNIPAWYLCSKAHMCPYGAHLTYKKVCGDRTQWCVDVKRAVLCDKLTYCRQNVWKSEKPSL